MLRRAAYLLFMLAVLFGSFFVTLTEPQVPKALDNHSDAERLAAYPISDLSGLTKLAQDAKLTLSRRLLGWVDAIYRTDDRAANRREVAALIRAMRALACATKEAS